MALLTKKDLKSREDLKNKKDSVDSNGIELSNTSPQVEKFVVNTGRKWILPFGPAGESIASFYHGGIETHIKICDRVHMIPEEVEGQALIEYIEMLKSGGFNEDVDPTEIEIPVKEEVPSNKLFILAHPDSTEDDPIDGVLFSIEKANGLVVELFIEDGCVETKDVEVKNNLINMGYTLVKTENFDDENEDIRE